jgi:endonuclease III-like uncharacterized protein
MMMDDYTYRRLTIHGGLERDPEKVKELVEAFREREMPNATFAEALVEFVKRYPRYEPVVLGIEQ